jgi:putative membrane protein
MFNSTTKMAHVAAYVAICALLAIHPYDRATWALENSVPLIEGLLVIWYARWRGVELTGICYSMILLHLVIQMIGGHYSYERVPLFDWLRDYFGWSRNHYDRVGHFALGFCLYLPIREICLRRTPLSASRPWAAFFTFMTISAVAGLWEVWEWLVAVLAYPDLGSAYLGTQGDPWDAQKDIVLAPIGAAVAGLLFARWHDRILDANALVPTPTATNTETRR